MIYGEYLFIENGITGMLLLWLTGRLSGQHPRPARLAAGGLLSGAAAFTLFLPLPVPAAAALRMAAAVVITFAGLGASAPAALFKKAILFFGLTFLSGGAAMALLLWQQIPALSGNGALYVDRLTYGRLLLWGSAAFGIAYVFIQLVRGERRDRQTCGTLQIFLQGREYVFSAMVDTGNALREPVSGRPVMLIDRKAIGKLPSQETLQDRYTVIPYRAVGTACGLLEGFRCEKAVFRGKDMGPAVIGLYEGNLGPVEAIVSREVMDCELYEEGKTGTVT